MNHGVEIAFAVLTLGLLGCSEETPPDPTDQATPSSGDTSDTDAGTTDTSNPGDDSTDTVDEITYSLRTEFGSVDTLEVVTQSIFAIWWDPKFAHSADAPVMFEQLARLRRD